MRPYARRLRSDGRFDIVDTRSGHVVRIVKTKSAAMQVVASLNGRARPNPSKRKAKKRAALSAKKLAAWVRSQTNRRPRRRAKPAARRKNPTRVSATVTGGGTGWIKSKATRIITRGRKKIVEIAR